MNKNLTARLLALILCLTMLTLSSCEEDEEDVKQTCNSDNYDPSSANYTCSNGYVAVGNSRCCPPNALYFCPTTGKCYASCEAASNAGCGNVVYASSGSAPSPGAGGSTSGVCATAYKHLSDAQLDAYCGYAYAYRCLNGKPLSDPGVQSVCNSYNQIKTKSAPDCPYCK